MTDHSRLIEIFENLIAIPSITDDQLASKSCLDYAETILVNAGLHINRYVSNGFPSLVATSRDTKTPAVMLQAHIDVVPADQEMFKLSGEGSHLCGRGVYDMKYAAACYLRLVEELGESCADYDFGIMLTADEEQGGLNGVSYLLDQGYGAQVCILPDGGDNWRLETAAKGGWQVEVVASGHTAHSSRPWEGDNAAIRLLHFLSSATALAPAQTHTDTTMVVSRLLAGDAVNQVPDEARAWLDIRYLDKAAYADISKKLMKVLNEHDMSIASDRLIQPLELDVTLPVVQRWQDIVADVRGVAVPHEYALSFGASDARFFAEHGIPAIVTRPDGGGMHSADEWIDEVGLYDFYACIRRYITEYEAAPA